MKFILNKYELHSIPKYFQGTKENLHKPLIFCILNVSFDTAIVFIQKFKYLYALVFQILKIKNNGLQRTSIGKQTHRPVTS